MDEVRKFSESIHRVLLGFNIPLMVPNWVTGDKKEFVNKVLEKHDDKIIVKVKLNEYLNNEVTTIEMFYKAFLDALREVCDDKYILNRINTYYDSEELYMDKNLYNFVGELPGMIVDTSEYNGMVIVFEDYFDFHFKFHHPDWLYSIFRNSLLPYSLYKVCYILNGDYDLFNKRVFKASCEYLDDEDILIFKINRNYDKSSVIHLGYREELELDEYGFPAALKIYYLSRIYEVDKKHLSKIDGAYLTITFESNDVFVNCRFTVDVDGFKREFNYILNDFGRIYYGIDSFIFEFEG